MWRQGASQAVLNTGASPERHTATIFPAGLLQCSERLSSLSKATQLRRAYPGADSFQSQCSTLQSILLSLSGKILPPQAPSLSPPNRPLPGGLLSPESLRVDGLSPTSRISAPGIRKWGAMDGLQGRSQGAFWLEVLRPVGKTLALVKSEPLPLSCLAPLPPPTLLPESPRDLSLGTWETVTSSCPHWPSSSRPQS